MCWEISSGKFHSYCRKIDFSEKLFHSLQGFLLFAQEVEAKIAFWNTEEFPYYHNGLAVEMLLYQLLMYRLSQEI